MKTRFKSKLVVALLAFAMAISAVALVPFVSHAPFTASAQETVTPTISNNGVVSWEDFGEGSPYIITVVDSDSKYVFSASYYYSTSYNVKERLDSLRVVSGDYSIIINSKNNVRSNGITYSYTSPFVALEAPENLAWNGTIATWSAVEHASSYAVQLISEEGHTIINKTVYDTSFDFVDYLEHGATFKVLAKAGNYLDGEYALSAPFASYVVKFSAGTGSGKIANVALDPMGETEVQYIAPGPDGLYSPAQGKVFSKWRVEYTSGTKKGQTTFVEAGGVLSIDGDVRLVAMWTNDVYTVTFDSNGNEGEMEAQSVEAGSVFTFPACNFISPKVSMVFDHWEIEGENTQYAPGDTCELYKNVTVKAVWKNRFADQAVAVKWGLDGDTAFGIGAPVSINIEAMCQNSEFRTAYLGREIQDFYWYSDGTLVGTGLDYTLQLTDGGKKIKAGIYFTDGTIIYSLETTAMNEITHVNVDMPMPCVGTAMCKDLSFYDAQGITVESAKWVDENFSAVTTVEAGVQYDCFLKVVAPNDYKFYMEYDGGNLVYPKLISEGDSYTYNASDTSGANKFITFIVRCASVSELTVSFDANSGSGEMISQNVASNAETKTVVYTLPECAFTAPNGKVFVAWSVNGTQKQAGEEITLYSNTVVKAIWKNNQVPYAYYSDGNCVKDGVIMIGTEHTLLDPQTLGMVAPEGKKFAGWAVGNINAEPIAAGEKLVITNEISMYAIWEDVSETPEAPENPESPETPETPDSPDVPKDNKKEEGCGGCGSVVGGAIGAVSLACVGAFLALRKRKED